MSFTHVSELLPGESSSEHSIVRLLKRAWPDLVGEEASRTVPVSIRRATLTVEVEGEEAGEYIKGARRELIKSVNAILGDQVVLRVRWVPASRSSFTTAPLPLPDPDEETLAIAAQIEDDILRERFIRYLCAHRAARGGP